VKIRELLSDPTRWTQHFLSRDEKGNYVSPESEEACAWCFLGAVYKCYDPSERGRILDRIYAEIGSIAYLNDGHANYKGLTGYQGVVEVVTTLDI
jgi:hypothetical protein